MWNLTYILARHFLTISYQRLAVTIFKLEYVKSWLHKRNAFSIHSLSLNIFVHVSIFVTLLYMLQTSNNHLHMNVIWKLFLKNRGQFDLSAIAIKMPEWQLFQITFLALQKPCIHPDFFCSFLPFFL